MKLLRKGSEGTPPLVGEIEVPGDKSISHRAIVIASLARGRSAGNGLNVGDDVQATAAAMARLGAGVTLDEDTGELEVEGSGAAGLHEPDAVIDARNSGTTLRVLAGVCAGVPGLHVLTGDEALLRRPMLRVVVPLRQMGARIDGRAHGDRAPLAVRGGDLSGVEIETSVASAQLKTALLLAGMQASGVTSVSEPSTSRDHTERLLEATGVPVGRDGNRVWIEGGREPSPVELVVPGDLSSAAFLAAAALLVAGSELTISGVGLNPTRSGLLDVLERMGAKLEVEVTGEEAGEPVGNLTVGASTLQGVEVEGEALPRMIDEVPVLAVLATQAEGTTVIRDAHELRVKESDRIDAMATALGALGGDVEALADGLVIRGPTPLEGAEVDSRGDHRVALALAVAGLVARDKVRIKGWSCVDVSFPEFLDVLGRAQGRKV